MEHFLESQGNLVQCVLPKIILWFCQDNLFNHDLLKLIKWAANFASSHELLISINQRIPILSFYFEGFIPIPDVFFKNYYDWWYKWHDELWEILCWVCDYKTNNGNIISYFYFCILIKKKERKKTKQKFLFSAYN